MNTMIPMNIVTMIRTMATDCSKREAFMNEFKNELKTMLDIWGEEKMPPSDELWEYGLLNHLVFDEDEGYEYNDLYMAWINSIINCSRYDRPNYPFIKKAGKIIRLKQGESLDSEWCTYD